MQKNNNLENRIIESSNETFIITDYEYTQPPIFNLINATKYSAIPYAIFSIIGFYFLNIVYYPLIFIFDALMILTFIYYKYVVLNNVRNGKIAKCSALMHNNIKKGKVLFSIMRSAFIRTPVLLAILYYKTKNTNLESGFFTGYSKELLLIPVFLAIIFMISSYSVFFSPKNFDAKKYHYDVIAYCKNKMASANSQTVVTASKEKRINLDISEPMIPEINKSPSYEVVKTTIKNEPKTTNKPKEQVNNNTSNGDVFQNKRVTRNRRTL